jgi:hypothetical protein
MKTGRKQTQSWGWAVGLGLLLVAAAVAGAATPELALRMVEGDLQVGTLSKAPYYLQWCTPMGEWENWNENTAIDPEIPAVWFRGWFEDVEAEEPMLYDPPEDVSFFGDATVRPDDDGWVWISVGEQDADGAVRGIPTPTAMPAEIQSDPPPPVYATPKNNQAVATPDPGRVRLYWQNSSTRQPVIWHLGDSGVRKGGVVVSTGNPASSWRIVGTADIDGDGTEDLVWHNSSSGRVVIWFLDPDGAFRSSQLVLDSNLSTAWKIAGVRDMNKDGVPDLIFHHATTGRTHIWSLNSQGEYVSGWNVVEVNPSTAWRIRGVEDMDGDDNPDLIWHHTPTGRAHIWFLDAEGKYVRGTNVANVNVSTAWQIVAVQDMNQDDVPDLVWHHATTGRAHIWFLNDQGTYVSGTNVADVNLARSWKIKGVRDVNADGYPDLIWHNNVSGRTHTWFLNETGNYLSGTNATSANLSTSWQIYSTSD